MTGLVASAAFGFFLGPILNFAIDRLPPVEDDVHQSSASGQRATARNRSRGLACDGRRHGLSWLLFLPLVGYAVSRGRCRACGEPLGIRRPLIELAAAGLFTLSWQRFEGDAFQFAAVCGFAAVFLALGVMDLETQFLPDRLVIPAAAAALAVSPFWPQLNAWDGGIGVAAGLAVFFPFAWYGDRTGREVMGWGDIKFSGLMGAVLGLQMLVLGLYVGILLGGIVAVAILIARSGGNRPRVIPFGTFLALGSVTALYYGRPIIDWVQDFIV